MGLMRAAKFSGYEALQLVDVPKPAVTDGNVPVRLTAAGVTPLEHTIPSGHFPIAKAPLVLGSDVLKRSSLRFAAARRVPRELSHCGGHGRSRFGRRLQLSSAPVARRRSITLPRRLATADSAAALGQPLCRSIRVNTPIDMTSLSPNLQSPA